MNIGQWIERVASQLEAANLHFGHGTDNALDEAAWLVMHVAGVRLDGSFDEWDRPVGSRQQELIESHLARRVQDGEPLAYILGSAWFAGLEFEVNPTVLVPRSPIAELIGDRFRPWIDGDSISQALDLCTGSGCLAIAIAHYMPQIQVVASDISPEALQVARRNVARHKLESRVKLIQSDLFEDLPAGPYDLIVSNPPYVSAESMQELPAEYRAEPRLGLESGLDGLDACLQIMVQSADFLTDTGILVCEVGESEESLQAALPGVPFIWLEFSSGGSGVFLLGREELHQATATVRKLIKERSDVR